MKMKEKIIGTLSILILSIIFLVAGYMMNRNKEEAYEEVFINEEESLKKLNSSEDGKNNNSENNDSESQGNKDGDKIVVDIKGEVKNPREYELKEGSRVRDLIDMAGGLTEESDKERIYFSKVLEDEQCIKIYKIGEDAEELEMEVQGQQENGLKTVDLKGKININKATVEELMTVPGIGKVKAQSIIDYRNENGKFKSVDELTNITGIGAKTLEKLRDKVDIK
ncbi:helix-hairpin-helix domain-containing protein [Clostridium sp. UBA1056]|uniref:helix-hairpin-helix domain-containing protein n=1 Tax=unclassified Clostridium TaxID=2614128 RepID=UPI0032165838